MSGTADYIREAREQKGLTLTQVEEATRIPRYYLEILEGGGDGRLVSDRLYMVHFLRTYASFLEVEVETLAAQFVRENRQPEPAAVIPVRQPRSWKATAMVTLALLLGAVIGVYLYDPPFIGVIGGPVERLLVKSAPAPPETPAPGTPPIPVPPPRTDDAQSSVLQPEATETDPSKPRLVAKPPASPPEPAPAPALEPVAALQQPPPAQPDVAASPAAQDVTVPSTAGGEPAPSATEDTPAPQTDQVAAVSPPAPDAPASPPAQEFTASQGEDTTDRTTSTAEPQQQQGPDSGTQTAQGPDPAAAPEVAALSTPPDTAAAGTPANHTLTIAAEQKSWMRIWVDGEPFQDLLLGPGESRTLSAQTHFVITFGNAGGVRLTLNGEALPPVGRSGEVVRGRKFPPDE
ncbi:MAG: DUF4115 domain-containing protein [Deltaproteobacteria bacterium]|nr:DUF4115 domain-containing protein [Deltaproteobacteria bacterium]